MSPGTLTLLFLGSVAAAAISGAAGFGGALLLLPLLIGVVGAERAVPLLTVAQLVGNLSRVILGLRSVCWRPVGWFLGGAVPGAVVGSLALFALPSGAPTHAIGAAIIGLVVARRCAAMPELQRHKLAGAGAVVGFISGLAGSAGPLGAAVFLSLGLPPVSYVASEAATAVAMHVVKTLVYQRFVYLDVEGWSIAALLSVGMVAGTWLGRGVIRRLSPAAFRVFVEVLLVGIGGWMVVAG